MAKREVQPWTLPGERWLPIPEFETYYEASDLGRARSLDRVFWRSDGRKHTHRGRVLSPRSHSSNGHYPVVNLCKEGTSRIFYVHRLVLLAFVGECPDGMEVRHLNGDPADARLVNLEYSTHIENIADIKLHGRNHRLNLTHCPYGHELALPNLVRSRLPYRTCLACNRTRPEVARLRRLGLSPSHQEISDGKYASIMAGEVARRDRGSDVCRWGHPLVPLNLVPSARFADCLACSRTYGVVLRAKARGESPDFQAISDQKFAEIAGLVRTAS